MKYWKDALKGALSGVAILCFVIPFAIGLNVLIPRIFEAFGDAIGCMP